MAPVQLVELAGTDAIAYAQAQFASDLRQLQTGQWQWSAWLNPQGRLRSLFQLAKLGSERLLLRPQAGESAALAEALRRFVFRSKVKITLGPEWAAFGIVGVAGINALAQELGTTSPDTFEWSETGDAALEAIGYGEPLRRVMLLASPDRSMDLEARFSAKLRCGAAQSWHLLDIRASIPTLQTADGERFLAHWLGLDRLGAIALGKGCYPGQEIVARVHFLGQTKRQLRRLRVSPAAGGLTGLRLQVAESGANAGEIVDSAPAGAACEVLAVVQDGLSTVGLAVAGRPELTVEAVSLEMGPAP